jgi:predicted Fe-S protein YdhL (DUF1289 family)
MTLKRTPCIGICSTTYGDLVCRGCKRFAHEIVAWNGFDPDQRRLVWERLLALRSGAASAVLEVIDETRLRQFGGHVDAGAEDLDPLNLVYEVLRRLQWRETYPALDALGVRLRSPTADAVGAAPATGPEGAEAEPAPAHLLARIDAEFYRRSLAQYERNFRIPPE